MAADAAVVNRALQLIGTRTTVTASELTGNTTNEAIQANLVYDQILAWCLGLFNWSFARKTAALTLLKTSSGTPIWTIPAQPSPPWEFEYQAPTDMIMPRWITDTAAVSNVYLGNAARFQMGYNLVSAVDRQVILTNVSSAVLVYTALIPLSTFWPWYFERLMSLALAESLCMALTGDKALTEGLYKKMMQQITIAEHANRAQGLIFDDATPEWVTAIGVNSPLERNINAVATPGRQAPSGDKPNGD